MLYIALNPLFVSRAAVSQKSILQKYLTRVSHKSLQSQECLTKVWYKTVTSYSLPRVSYSQQITRARYKWASHKSGIASQRHVVVFSHVFSRTLDSPCFVRVCGSHLCCMFKASRLLKMNNRTMLAKARTHEATCKYVDVLRASTGIRSKQLSAWVHDFERWFEIFIGKIARKCMTF